MEGDKRDLREIAKAIEGEGVCCNCDLDNWEPERTTGHSHVCRIHKRAMMMKFRPHDMRAPNAKVSGAGTASAGLLGCAAKVGAGDTPRKESSE